MIGVLIFLLLCAVCVFLYSRKMKKNEDHANSPVEDTFMNKRQEPEQTQQTEWQDPWPDDYRPTAQEMADAESHFLNVCDHTDPEQAVRFERAMNPAYTGEITSIDREKKAAIARTVRSSQSYHVSLYKCNCSDYFNRNLPCKHMYKLALALGTVSPDWDLSGISQEDKEKLDSLKISNVAALVKLMQEHPGIASEAFSAQKKKIPTALIKNGFLIDQQLYDIILDKCYTFSELRDPASSRGIKARSKAELIQRIMSEAPDLAETLCAQYCMLSFAPLIANNRDRVYRYLEKKLEQGRES